MLCEVVLLAGLGISIGVAAGATLPFLVVALFGDLLPAPVLPGPFPGPLALAALFGTLVAGAFSLWPLGRAHDVPGSQLFRDLVAPDRGRPRARYAFGAGLLALALVAAAIGFAWDRLIATIAVLACAAAFLLLRGVGAGAVALLRKMPAPRNPLARLAFANLHRPGAATTTVIVSLGLGVTLMVALAVIDATVSRELTRSLPKRAPNFYFLDVPGRDGESFARLVETTAPGAVQQRVPMMRGRIVSLAGVPAEKVKAAEDVAWVLEGDRGITFSAVLPEGAKLVGGEWWPPDYSGPPLVSMERDIAKGLGVEIGDSIVINVLGRNVEARIANLRSVEWSSLAINFVMVFSPNAFTGAPFNDLATLRLKDGGTPREESAVVKAVASGFPTVTSLRVKDVLEAIDGLMRKLLVAVRGASAVSLLSAVLVLAGALAAGRRLRLYDAVVLKNSRSAARGDLADLPHRICAAGRHRRALRADRRLRYRGRDRDDCHEDRPQLRSGHACSYRGRGSVDDSAARTSRKRTHSRGEAGAAFARAIGKPAVRICPEGPRPVDERRSKLCIKATKPLRSLEARGHRLENCLAGSPKRQATPCREPDGLRRGVALQDCAERHARRSRLL